MGNQTHAFLCPCQLGEVEGPGCLWKGGGMVSFTSAFLHAEKVYILSTWVLKVSLLNVNTPELTLRQIGLLSYSMLILLVNTAAQRMSWRGFCKKVET